MCSQCERPFSFSLRPQSFVSWLQHLIVFHVAWIPLSGQTESLAAVWSRILVWLGDVVLIQSKHVGLFNIEVKSTGCEHTCLKSSVAARGFVKSDEIILMSSGFSQLWLGDYTFTTDSLWYRLWLCVYQWKSSVRTFCGARDHQIQIYLLLIPLTSPYLKETAISIGVALGLQN